MAARIALDLRRYRQFADAAGWSTQADAAAALNVNETTIWRVINGKTAPSGGFIAALLAIAIPRGWEFHDLFTVVADTPAAAKAVA